MSKFNFPAEPIQLRELKEKPLTVRLATPEQNFGCLGVAREINALYADMPSDDVMWQPDVYTEARLLADRNGIKRIVDVGCGNGEKLVHNFPAEQFQTVGLDFHGSLELATSVFPHARWVECDLNSSGDLAKFFGALNPAEPVLMILSDVIEHIPDPRLLLGQLRTVLLQHPANRLIVSTPDRHILDYQTYGNAPDNLSHVREWTHEELADFCIAGGFQIERIGHTRANQFDAKYSTIYVELRCEPTQYLHFLKEQGLLHADVLPSHLLVTAEYPGLDGAASNGCFVAAQRQAYGQENTLCLYIGQQDKLPAQALQNKQLVTPQILTDEHDWPLPIEDLVLKATLQLLFYFPQIRTVEYVDSQGHGCRLAQAKRANLFPQWVEVVVFCQGATHFFEDAGQAWSANACPGIAEREKISIENADTVVFPTWFMRELYRECGIDIADEKILRLRNPYFAKAGEIAQTEAVDTVVFHGERSAANGYALFIEALTLGAESLQELGIKRILFIGPHGKEEGADDEDLAQLREQFELVKLPSLGQASAMEQLRAHAPRAVCVLPRLGQNHPYAMLAASFAGIPTLMLRAGGAQELYPEPFDRVLLADPSEAALLSALEALVRMSADERHRLRGNFQKVMVSMQAEINQAFQAFGRASRTLPAVERPRGRASVIVPVYNTELEFIRDLVFGLNNQSMSPAEVIFVDDGSQPGYASQLEELLQRELRLPYRLISHLENKGLSSARNTALNAVNTEYVINIDSDDVPLNDFVRNIVCLLEANPRAGAAVPYLKSFEQDTDFNKKAAGRQTYFPFGDGVLLSMLTNHLGHANSGYRTDVIRGLGGWDASENSMWEDWALLLKLVSSGYRIGIIPQADCLYRVRKQSMLRKCKEWPAMRRLSRNVAGLPRFDSFRLQALLYRAREEEKTLAQLREERSATDVELVRLRNQEQLMTSQNAWLRAEGNAMRTELIALRARVSTMDSELARSTAELNRASVRATRRIVAGLERAPVLVGLMRAVGKGLWKLGRGVRNLARSK